jgi:carbamate kinase
MVALGGNALLQRGEKPDAQIQRRHVRRAARALAPLAAEHELILCHGNGPQVGLLALESESDPTLSRPYPLDVLGAQTQGMIGYWLAQELRNAGVGRPVVAVVTQTVVDAADPAFAAPAKFIGPVYTENRAQRLARQHKWSVAPDGAAWRRVVPSPDPVTIVERDTVRQLLATGTVVICGGGGGVPVVEDGDAGLRGVEAVVDKDLTAAMIAADVCADRLLVLTDVTAVMSGFGTAEQAEIRQLALGELAQFRFPAGSMAPKIAACARYTRATGNASAIGALDDAVAVLDGRSGTTIGPR